MPQEVINWVNQLGIAEGQVKVLTFFDRKGNQIGNTPQPPSNIPGVNNLHSDTANVTDPPVKATPQLNHEADTQPPADAVPLVPATDTTQEQPLPDDFKTPGVQDTPADPTHDSEIEGAPAVIPPTEGAPTNLPDDVSNLWHST